jgi:DNA-directed RNA polymerase subunit L|tara:strand:- start:65 stop:358 length:294 start_codon:yes stop_codon:yes gene_type:complete
LKAGRLHDGSITMPVKVLARDKKELRIRFIGESHTSLQILREQLNSDTRVEYANYFPGHPDLDDPEFYIRVKGRTSPEKILKELISAVGKDLSTISL